MKDRHKLYWLPAVPDWDARFQAAASSPTWDALVRLANHPLSFRETLRLDQLLSNASQTFPDRPESAKVLLLGSATVDHLSAGIRIAMLRRGRHAVVLTADYGDLSPEAILVDDPDVVLFAHDPFALTRGLSAALSSADTEDRLDQQVDEIGAQWRAATARRHAHVVQVLPSPAVLPNLLGQNEHRAPGTPSAFLGALNARLRTAAAAQQVDVLALDDAAARDGVASWFDAVAWHRAKQFVAPRAAPLFGDLVARIIEARAGRSAKCLVLDLDNTLWGGVVGDDGVEGIVIGQGSAEGEAFAAFQHYARQMAMRGIILAVASKNDDANAREPFQRHPDMVLREGDIASFRANWNDKAESLRAIAADLDIGVDSLVFVDDNPFERALVRQLEPRVRVPEVGDDPADFAQCLADAGYFEAVALTEEDRARTGLYTARAERQAAATSSTDMAAYLRDLDMRLIWGRVDRLSLARTAQLVGKTNQFNLTTRRHSEAAIAAMLGDPASLPLQFRLTDRFGDNGLIAVVIGNRRGDTLAIDTWLMSCRVLRRGVEEATLAALAAAARTIGCTALEGQYIPTAKNAMVADLYATLGFTQVRSDQSTGATTWRLSLDNVAAADGPITFDPPL